MKQKKQDIMRRRRQTYEESILIKNLQMIHSSYQKGQTVVEGSNIHLDDTMISSNLVPGMFLTGIPPRPQKEIIDEIKVLKILEKQ